MREVVQKNHLNLLLRQLKSTDDCALKCGNCAVYHNFQFYSLKLSCGGAMDLIQLYYTLKTEKRGVEKS